MVVWILQMGEPVHSDQGSPRPMRAMNFANKLVERGHLVVLWTSAFQHRTKTHRSRIYKEIKISENIEVRLIPSSGYISNISISRFYDHCVLAWNLHKQLKLSNQAPDAAFVGYPPIKAGYVMGSWLKKRNVPFLLDVKDQWPNTLVESFPGPMKFLARALLAPYYVMAKKSMQNATGICGHTSGFVNWALTFSNRDRSDNDFIAPLTTPNDVLERESMDSAQDWWSNQGVVETSILRVMFVGSFSMSFDFDTIFSAASVLQAKKIPCEFILCGYGSQNDKLRSVAKDYDNIKIIEWIDRPKIIALSQISHATIAPYKSTNDFTISVPNKILDSLMLGLPIISPLKGEVTHLIKRYKVGLTYNDSLSLVKVIRSFTSNFELQKTMSSNAKNLYKSKFEFNMIYDELVCHLESIATKE